MATTPVLTGHVNSQGQMFLDDRARLDAHLLTLAGKEVEIVVRQRRTKRSLQQNRWLWGVAIPELAHCLGYDRHEHEQLHYAMVEKCFGCRWDDVLKTYVPNARSSKLTVKEFGEYMEWFVRFSAQEFGCLIPLPDEADLDAVEDAA